MTHNGLWLTPNRFVDFSEAALDKRALTEEIASRQAAWDWSGFMGLLPDPDPILRKLGGGAEILEELTADAHLCSVIQSRKLGTLKKEFRWAPGSLSGEKPSRQAQRLCADLVADLERVDLYNLVSSLLDAPYYGMTAVEIKWESGDGRLRIRDLEAKPARWFGFDEENHPRFLSLQSPWDGLELPFGKFVIARHFPTYDNPFGLRLLSRCFWPAVFKKGGIKFWVTLAEKYGMPFLVGKYRPGAPLGEQQEMLSKLVGMVRDACAVIPQGGTVEILESGKGGASAEIHSGLKAAMDAEMSKVIMGQTLTAEVSDKGGSRAQGQVHEEILEDFRQGDQTLVRIAMEEMAWLYGQVNAPGVPTPKFSWFEEEDPKATHAERDKTLRETGLRFRKGYYLRTYGFQEDDFDLEQTAQTPDSPKKGAPADEEEFAQGAGFPDQAALDAALSLLPAEALQGQMETVLRPLIERIAAGESFEALQTSLAETYPDMETAALEEMLSRAIFVAEIWGRLHG